MENKRVLLAEKDINDISAVRDIFIKSGHQISTVVDGLTALEKITRDKYDLLITELDLPRMNGIDLLKNVKKINSSIPIILISSNARVHEAVEAMKLGAFDFILKPLTEEMIKIIISQTSNNLFTKKKAGFEKRFPIITKNMKMKKLLMDAEKIADSQASVFIQGESGTGKELFARHIHYHSKRKDCPFVAINCSALPETLLESELFGYEKGSFTGAFARKKGKFEIANHGTILLDEISEMNIYLQSKLLRVLQEKEIDRIGGTNPVSLDVRVIATTNRAIEKYIQDGRIREDLYYRLNVIPFHMPPLRERRDDIPLLANYFIEKYNRLDNRNVKGLTQEIIDLIIQMPWKGNVRELENLIERAVLMSKRNIIDDKQLFTNGKKIPVEDKTPNFIPAVSLKEMEKTVIMYALDQTNGNRTHAADLLGISVRTLRNKLNEYRKKMETE